MPIYEYGCRSCRTRSSILVRSYDAPTDPACQHCGVSDIVKLVSGFAVIRSEEDLMSGHDQMDWLYDLDPDDPEGLQKIKDWSNKSGVPDDGPMGPDNVHQDDLGVPGFGPSPMMGPAMPGGLDDGAHGDFHGI